MADSGVYDRWHRSKPKVGEAHCREHDQVPTADHGQGKRWQTRWRDDTGKQRKLNYDKKSDAERQLTSIRADLLRGTYVDHRAGKVTLREYAEQRWLPVQHHLRPNSTELYESHLRNHVVPLLGRRQVGALRRTDMKTFVAALAQKLAPSTVHTVYAVLRAVMSGAVDDGLIPGNPCSRVPLPRIDKKVITPLSAEQVTALAEAITPRYRVSVWLGAGAGLREGETLGLIVPRVAFLARRLDVIEQMQNGQLCPLKTKASERKVPVDDVVLNEITNHLARWPAGKPDQLVVTNRCNRPVQRSSFGHCWQKAVADARTCGKQPPEPGERLTKCRERCGDPAHMLAKGTRFHDLRHFYASTLIAAGLHPKTIQARLGHATIAETMDTYGHLFPDADEAGRGALDAAFAPAVPRLCPAEES